MRLISDLKKKKKAKLEQVEALRVQGVFFPIMSITFRKATANDLPQIIKWISEDHVGELIDSYTEPIGREYVEAFERIIADENHLLLLAERNVNENEKQTVAFVHVVFILCLSHHGRPRCHLQSFRVDHSLRRQGIGTSVIKHVIELAKQRNCSMLQLSVNKLRVDAQRFYLKLGFKLASEGMKLNLA